MQDGAKIIKNELADSKLPPLPHVLVELLRACQDQTSSFQDMARIVSNDAVIASQVILVANSSFYGRRGGANTIERALLLLGTEQLKTIAITASVQQMCSGFNVGSDYLKSFWSRSLRCALISKALALLTSYDVPEEAYLLGLLHNIGELVLAVNHVGDYPAVLHQSGVSQIEEERVRFGTDHCELGQHLARRWSLNDLEVDAIAYHHAPLNEIADSHHLAKILYLAAHLAEEPVLSPDEGMDVSVDSAAEQLFGLSGALAREIAVKVTHEVAQLASALGIDLESSDGEDFLSAREKLQQQMQRRLMNQEMSTLLDGDGASDTAISEKSVTNALNIMFGYRQALIVRFDSKQQALIYRPEADPRGEIKVPLEASSSLLARCGREGGIRYSHRNDDSATSLTVVDQQLMRVCRSHAMIYVPCLSEEGLMAVLVIGDLSSLPPDDVNQALLEDFSDHLAQMLLKGGQAREPATEVVEMQAKVRAAVHEVNNPLTIIRNYLEALSSAQGDEADESRYTILREEIDRASQILMRLQDIESDTSGIHERSINDEIKSLVSVFEQSICKSNGIACSLSLSSQLDGVVLPRNQLRQILTNLIKNSAEAMASGGEIKVKTGLTISSVKGRSLELIIEDTGPGIPESVMMNLFKPGFSTKEGNHSGLGLSITRSLVEEVGGTIACQSSDGGTQFTITIPLEQ